MIVYWAMLNFIVGFITAFVILAKWGIANLVEKIRKHK